MIDKKIFKDEISFIIKDNKYIFKQLEFSDISDDLDIIKSKLKKITKLYSSLINVISPVYIDKHLKKFLNRK